MSSHGAADHASAAGERGLEAETTDVRPIVICEECGRKYIVSPSKIQGKVAGFTCRHCGHRIVVARTQGPQQIETLPWPLPSTSAPVEPQAVQPPARRVDPARRLMLLSVFGGIMAVVMAGVAVFFVMRTHGILEYLERQRLQASRQLAEERIGLIAADAVERVRQRLELHPDLDRRDLARDPHLRSIVMQPVGAAGQVMLYALPELDGAWRVWLHPDPSLIGGDLSARRSELGPYFHDFWKAIRQAADGTPSTGFYRALGADGNLHEQAMACRPVAGTTYILAAVAPVAALAGPLIGLQAGAVELIREIGFAAAGLLGGTALALALMVLLCKFRGVRPGR
jgi:DNA-directed RNA polymerase subunit RPC12/RpoP